MDDSDSGEKIHIQNYLYPAACGNKDPQYKGIVFMVHGFGGYGANLAHIGEMFSKLGYDFFIQDSRGHGKSEG